MDADRVAYEPDPTEALTVYATRRGVSPAEAFLDMALESDAKGLWNYPFLNFDFDAIEAKIKAPRVILGIGDAGAHCGQIQEASQSTYFLTRWVRDAGTWTVEEGIKMLSSEGADLFGFEGRGRLVEGGYADVNIIDLEGARTRRARIRPRLPERRRPVDSEGPWLRPDNWSMAPYSCSTASTRGPSPAG